MMERWHDVALGVFLVWILFAVPLGIGLGWMGVLGATLFCGWVALMCVAIWLLMGR
jgi:hypothetical protein